MNYQLIDGETRHAESPRTFPIPSESEKRAVKIGDFAKIGVLYGRDAGERFWVQVISIEWPLFAGTIANNPVGKALHGLTEGARIEFQAQHILRLDVPEEPSPTRWFGPTDKPDAMRKPTPIGARCVWCHERIAKEDYGFFIPMLTEAGPGYAIHHRECFIRSVAGSVAHQEQRCCCFGGRGEDDPNLSVRAAARAAFECVRARDAASWPSEAQPPREAASG